LPTAPTETTSPEETWPEVVSDQNITNIMFIGNAARPDDTERFSDSNILVSINRETKTITLTSIIRDLRVVIPAYAGHTPGFNRINHVYHLGSYYTGHKEDSMKLMAHVRDLIEEKGYVIENIDATVIAQKPKLRPYIDQMEENIAKVLRIERDQINVKATTEEHLGFTGREEGMAAQAICSLATFYEASMPVGCDGGCGGCGR